MSWDPSWLRQVRVDADAVARRAEALAAQEPPRGRAQAIELLEAVSSIDLTTLTAGDTAQRVAGLCARARQPVRPEILGRLATGGNGLTVAAVCVYPRFVDTVLGALEGSQVRVATVAAGFPTGVGRFEHRVAEILAAVEMGAHEIDAVIARGHAWSGDWRALFEEVEAFRRACGAARLKAILGTGELRTPVTVYKAALVCMMAGADFVKTSTGKEAINATVPVGLVLSQAIREFYQRTGARVGLKPAGGITTAADALTWRALVREELGLEWLCPELFRIGASSLLDAIERRLERLGWEGRSEPGHGAPDAARV